MQLLVAPQVFVPLGILTGVPGVTWEAFLFKNLIPGELPWIPACAILPGWPRPPCKLSKGGC